MKKLLLFFVLGLSVVSVSAQYIGMDSDTITMQDADIYMYNPMPNRLGKEGAFSGGSLALGTLTQQYVPQDTVILYGIALTICDGRVFDSIYQNPDYKAVLMQRPLGVPDSIRFSPTHPSDSIIIRTLHYLDSFAIDTTQRAINITNFQYQFNYPKPSNAVVPCYEIYFDKPRVMTDTFYVGRKNMAIPPLANEYGGRQNRPPDIHYFWYNANEDAMLFRDCNYWGFAFPIIGFHCKPLDEESHSLLLTDVNDNGATVQWYSAGDGTTYNVRLTSADGSIDSTVVTSDSIYTFYGLPTNHRYNVRVRKQCYYATSAYDTTVYSPWTMTNTSFTLGVDTTGSGGGGDTTHTAIVSAGGVDFSVSPNPVHGVLSVTFPWPMAADGQLALIDLGGREVRRMTVAAGSVKVDFDTEGCPAGAYLLNLITTQGITTRRILVE